MGRNKITLAVFAIARKYKKSIDISLNQFPTHAQTRKKNTQVKLSEIFEATLQKFDVSKENVLCLVVDNASNMTKTVERLNENDVPFKDPDEMHNSAVDEEVDSDG